MGSCSTPSPSRAARSGGTSLAARALLARYFILFAILGHGPSKPTAVTRDLAAARARDRSTPASASPAQQLPQLVELGILVRERRRVLPPQRLLPLLDGPGAELPITFTVLEVVPRSAGAYV